MKEVWKKTIIRISRKTMEKAELPKGKETKSSGVARQKRKMNLTPSNIEGKLRRHMREW